MKYAIITPTYKKHFQFIPKYLKSFEKFVEDKKEIPIFFTISQTENKEFQKVIKNYKKHLNIHILFIEDLFNENNIKESPEDYLKKYGRFTFQTAKKFYSMLHVDAEKFLVLDCESMWVRKTNMKKLFDNYFHSPFITISNLDKNKRIFLDFNIMLNNICSILNIQENQNWFIENFMWYYDKRIVLDLFNEYGSLIDMVSILDKQNKYLDTINDLKYGIFEIVLYYAYIFINKKKYGYKFVNADEILSENIPHNILLNYKYNFYDTYKGACGLIEHAMEFLDDSNTDYLANIFKENNFNIIRCDFSNIDIIDKQERFLNIVKPNILAASQNHAFGINNSYFVTVIKNKYLKKIQKHYINSIGILFLSLDRLFVVFHRLVFPHETFLILFFINK